jgi:hypothetical protein
VGDFVLDSEGNSILKWASLLHEKYIGRKISIILMGVQVGLQTNELHTWEHPRNTILWNSCAVYDVASLET